MSLEILVGKLIFLITQIFLFPPWYRKGHELISKRTWISGDFGDWGLREIPSLFAKIGTLQSGTVELPTIVDHYEHKTSKVSGFWIDLRWKLGIERRPRTFFRLPAIKFWNAPQQCKIESRVFELFWGSLFSGTLIKISLFSNYA